MQGIGLGGLTSSVGCRVEGTHLVGCLVEGVGLMGLTL